MMVNPKKSTLVSVQVVEHLGFIVNLEKGQLEVPSSKLKTVRKELGKLVTHQTLSPRKMAAILGVVRSFLHAMPFLRAFTGQMLKFVHQHSQVGWDTPLQVPTELKLQVQEISQLMLTWKGRTFGRKVPVRTFHSDSSSYGWAGLEVGTKNQVHDF